MASSSQPNTDSQSLPPYSSGAASNHTPSESSTNEEVEEVNPFSLVKKRKKTLVVWDHFNAAEINGLKKAICKGCNKSLSGDPKNGTSHLHDHIRKCVRLRPIQGVGQTKLSFDQKGEGKGKLMVVEFNQEVARRELCNMVVMHEYPLCIVEHEGFRRYSAALQPSFKMISRNTLRSDIFKLFEYEKDKTMSLLSSNKSRVSITTDMWTSQNQNKGFMAITAYWIDNHWTLQSRIIRFVYVPSPHTSEVLCDVLVNCLMEWNIDSKLSTLTVDNCTTNDALIGDLKNRFESKCFLLHGKYFHVHCAAHVLNIIVSYGMEIIQKAIENIRKSVMYWKATPKRLEKFMEVCRQKEIPYSRALIHDCRTRWNSTFLMLDVALMYEDVFARLARLESNFNCCPTSDEWNLARSICERLSLFYDVSLMFSGSRYPTVNLYFPKVCEVRMSLIEWSLDQDEIISGMATKMIEKFEKYWSVIHEMMAVATILDPRYKLKLVECYYSIIYGSTFGEEVDNVRKICYELFHEYEEKYKRRERSSSISRDPSVNSQSCGSSLRSATLGYRVNLDLHYEQWLANQYMTSVPQKTELDCYLEEPVMPQMDDFDVLSWWKTNTKYPILQRMARDVLAIPISTVASESAFSTSGRFVRPYRNRLHPKTLEALMCCRDWLWATTRNKDNDGTANSTYHRFTLQNDESDSDVSEHEMNA